MHRFEFHTGEAKLPSFDERGLVFRSLIEVGEEAFKAALIRISEGSLDRRRLIKRQQLRPEAEEQSQSLTILHATRAACSLVRILGGIRRSPSNSVRIAAAFAFASIAEISPTVFETAIVVV
ncbi:MAG: hypothetical protein WAV38_32765 [Xanthobacteraceae bacterium]